MEELIYRPPFEAESLLLQNWREQSKAILDKRPERAGEGAVILPQK